jgi:hypothetical protein
MRKDGLAIALVVTLLVLSGSSVLAQSQMPDVMTIVTRMKDIIEPSRPTVMRAVVTDTDSMGKTSSRVIGRAWKNFPEGKTTLLVVLAPKEQRGTAFFWREREKSKGETSYLEYVPFLRRVREFKGIQAYDGFAGSQFTYADLDLVHLDQRYKLLGTEERNGIQTYKIEEKIPGEKLVYSRIVMWVGSDSGVPVERDYYDTTGRLWKIELFKEVIILNDLPVPRIIEMRDVLQNLRTELKITMVSSTVDIPDVWFDPAQALQQKDWETKLFRLFGSEKNVSK